MMGINKFSLCFLVAASAVSSMLVSCDGLSSREKEFVGDYYIPVVSESTAALELRKDGNSVIRAEIPGELNVEVPGEWSIEDNNLVIRNKPEKIKVKGNRSLLGKIAKEIVRPIKSYDHRTLVLVDSGIEYAYHRRF